MADILRGGMDVLQEAGAIMLGGHSINDEELKFGLAVTGIIDPNQIMTNANAKPGDALVLTKPLGTGIISLAHQIDIAPAGAMDAVTVSMTTLNRTAAELMVEHGANACTDVTGFGLLGHLGQMVVESGVTAEIECSQLPLFEGVLECAKKGSYSGANERNAESVEDRVTIADDIDKATRAVLFDAQTSGGLLVSIPAENAERFLEHLHARGITAATIIGRITGESEGRVEVVG